MTLEEIVLVLGMALVTFFIRYPILALVGKLPLPESIFHNLRYVPPAVLAAIILPGMLINGEGQVDIAFDNTYLVAGLIAFVVAWRSRSILITIIVGMGSLLLLRFALGQL